MLVPIVRFFKNLLYLLEEFGSSLQFQFLLNKNKIDKFDVSYISLFLLLRMSLKYSISFVTSNFLCYKHTSKTVDNTSSNAVFC